MLAAVTLCAVAVYGAAVPQYKPIFDAIQKNDVAGVRDILQLDPKAATYVNESSPIKPTPLLTAAYQGVLPDIIELLLGAGADVNAVDQTKMTALGKAAFRGHLNIVKTLIKHHANVNLQGEGGTPLHLAVRGGHLEVVRELIKAGADTKIAAADGNAQQIAHKAYTAASRNKAANVDARMQIIKLLTPIVPLAPAPEPAPAPVPDIDRIDAAGNTPLHNAILAGNPAEVQKLLSTGAHTTIVNSAQETPVHTAIRSWKTAMSERKPEAQIKAYQDIILMLRPTIMLATKSGDAELVRLLIRNGANVKAKELGNNTALHWASILGYRDIADALISAGADINAKNDQGFSPLHDAVFNGQLDLVKFLIRSGIRLDQRDTENKTPLRLAFSRLNYESSRANNENRIRLFHYIITSLLSAAADTVGITQQELAQTDIDGNTALHWAVRICSPTEVQALIRLGVAKDRPNRKGQTPLQLAEISKNNSPSKTIARSYEEIIKILTR